VTKRFLILILCFLPSTVFAENVVNGLDSYGKIVIDFTKNAEKCELEDAKAYTAHLREKLAKLGISEQPESKVRLRLELGGIPLGMLDGQCVVAANLSVGTILQAKNMVAPDKKIQMAMDRAGSFEVTLYKAGAFAAASQVYKLIDGKSKSLVQWKLRDMIDRLANRLDNDRKL
jgi:hypothetical protein